MKYQNPHIVFGRGLFVCFGLLVFFISMTQYADFDLWWHMKLGESIIAAKSVYSADSFSYTYAGQPQFTGEWLSDLIIFLSYRIGGFAGINTLKALVLLLSFFSLQKAIKGSLETNRKTDILSAIVISIVVLFAIRFRLFVRPYLFSMVFISFFLFVLESDRKGANKRFVYLLPLATVLWANMSVGAVLAPVIVFIYFVPNALSKDTNLRLYLTALALTFAATLVSPEFYNIYTLTFRLFTDPFKSLVGEYQPMSRQILWGFGFRYTWGFQLLALLSTVYIVFFKGWKNTAHLLLFVFFLGESILQIRMIEFFAFAVAPMAVVPVRNLVSVLIGNSSIRFRMISAAMIVLILGLIPYSVMGSTTYRFGNKVKQDTFPDEALSFLDRNGIQGRMFNSYSIGGYIIWKAPEHKVFIDGRYRRLYSSDFYKEYTAMMKDTMSWKAGEEKYGLDYAVLEYDMISGRFPQHLNTDPEWALVYWDNHSCVYLKRIEKFATIIDKHSYRIAKPAFYDFSYLMSYVHSKKTVEAAEALGSDIALNPSNKEPVLARASLYYLSGPMYYDKALDDLQAASKLKPNLAMEHSASAMILLEKGQKDLALSEMEKARVLDPEDPGLAFLLKKLNR